MYCILANFKKPKENPLQLHQSSNVKNSAHIYIYIYEYIDIKMKMHIQYSKM